MDRSASLEIHRWGYANVPGIIFYYSKELDLEIEDIGIIATIIYSFQRAKPLYETGIEAGQVLQACPSLTKQKLSRRLNRLAKSGIIKIEEGNKTFADKEIYIEPLMDKLESLVIRDHPKLRFEKDTAAEEIEKAEAIALEYRKKVEQLELELDAAKQKSVSLNTIDVYNDGNNNYKKLADFIAKKTGNLLSVKMSNELKKWLDELAFTPEFLLCMLEFCFERKINNPRDITRIAKDLKEYSINTVEGLGLYFKNYVDKDKNTALRISHFDPDIIEFGNFTGIDMNAEARKKVYYKWRYDWRFSHAMIMKAGEIMCQRTKNGGLEYIDSVLHDWMSKEIRQVEDAEKEVREFKSRKKTEKKSSSTKKDTTKSTDYELYIPPGDLEEIKSKV
ncbi:MAG: DnaD domain protein [Syntrophomonadaceae bacterium]|nr:DnaD domain protein [Syntrophomonadaceae bacterium]MDD3889050.1 DnaD domain protein [Syntrophomonadaceae bacterium]MDD4549404.1 DnaD domain protein [Syntrophomonadaceae bacterium]